MNIKNLKINVKKLAAIIGISTAFAIAAEPMVVNAEEEILYEELDKTPREFGEDEFIDADNWSPEMDIDPNAGLEIPDDVLTEAERKGIVITPSTPVIKEPTPIPKTGEGVKEYVLAGGVLAGITFAGIGAFKSCKKAKERIDFLKSVGDYKEKDEFDDLDDEKTLFEVISSKIKFRKSKKVKKERKLN